ncbi:hypothetical protein [Bradyrhizobium yuanmingense]|uniref:hypothetical protein n=1 Tax=Bradyrhizobium yuanmingense TaxID=108015 RepID=UPI0023B932E2|nr:hypothetical protein [Bradyrhizobium yuanmingense]MDF0584723.1 hypothetical protein [Bradyrhizobium yuanmingense]
MADEKETVREVFFTSESSNTELFTAIGHFIFQFSQLETMIRHLLSEALGLKGDRNFNLIVSPYDFRTLCDVTSGYLRNLPDAAEEFQEKVRKTFNDCKEITTIG